VGTAFVGVRAKGAAPRWTYMTCTKPKNRREGKGERGKHRRVGEKRAKRRRVGGKTLYKFRAGRKEIHRSLISRGKTCEEDEHTDCSASKGFGGMTRKAGPETVYA